MKTLSPKTLWRNKHVRKTGFAENFSGFRGIPGFSGAFVMGLCGVEGLSLSLQFLGFLKVPYFNGPTQKVLFRLMEPRNL